VFRVPESGPARDDENLSRPLAHDKVALEDGFVEDNVGLATLVEGSVSQSADKVGLLCGLGLDIVPEVVRVVAGEVVTARGRGGVVCREDLLDSVEVIGVDDCRDVEESDAAPTIEGHLTQHAGNVRCAIGNGVPVPYPADRDVNLDILAARDLNRRNSGKAGIGGEDDFPGSLIERLESDSVGQGSTSAEEEETQG